MTKIVYQLRYRFIDDWKYVEQPKRYKYFFSLDAVNTWGFNNCHGPKAKCIFIGIKNVEVSDEQLEKLRKEKERELLMKKFKEKGGQVEKLKPQRITAQMKRDAKI